MRNTLKAVNIIFIFIGITVLFTACPSPLSVITDGEGELLITIGSEESPGTRSLENITYQFSGSGPDGSTFYYETSDSSATISDLIVGDWSIEIEGYNEDGALVLYGETTYYIFSGLDNELTVSLQTVSGQGDLFVSASWNSDYTYSPAVTVEVTDYSGTDLTENMDSVAGSAEATFSDLDSGYYTVSVRIYDSGEIVTGGTWTVRVLKDSTSTITADFSHLNKTGEKIVVTDESFELAWDSDSPDTDDTYRIYYRNRGEYEWLYLSEIDATTSPSFEISTSILSRGVYEFAVSAVAGGTESDLHTSMDDDADPVCGWYIEWL